MIGRITPFRKESGSGTGRFTPHKTGHLQHPWLWVPSQIPERTLLR